MFSKLGLFLQLSNSVFARLQSLMTRIAVNSENSKNVSDTILCFLYFFGSCFTFALLVWLLLAGLLVSFFNLMSFVVHFIL